MTRLANNVDVFLPYFWKAGNPAVKNYYYIICMLERDSVREILNDACAFKPKVHVTLLLFIFKSKKEATLNIYKYFGASLNDRKRRIVMQSHFEIHAHLSKNSKPQYPQKLEETDFSPIKISSLLTRNENRFNYQTLFVLHEHVAME